MHEYLAPIWIVSSIIFLIVNIYIMVTNKKTIYLGNIVTTVFGSIFGPIAWAMVIYAWLSYHWDDPILEKEEEE